MRPSIERDDGRHPEKSRFGQRARQLLATAEAGRADHADGHPTARPRQRAAAPRRRERGAGTGDASHRTGTIQAKPARSPARARGHREFSGYRREARRASRPTAEEAGGTESTNQSEAPRANLTTGGRLPRATAPHAKARRKRKPDLLAVVGANPTALRSSSSQSTRMKRDRQPSRGREIEKRTSETQPNGAIVWNQEPRPRVAGAAARPARQPERVLRCAHAPRSGSRAEPETREPEDRRQQTQEASGNREHDGPRKRAGRAIPDNQGRSATPDGCS